MAEKITADGCFIAPSCESVAINPIAVRLNTKHRKIRLLIDMNVDIMDVMAKWTEPA